MSTSNSQKSSPKKIAANRENAKKSTGPRNPRRRASQSLRQSRYVKSLSYDQAKLGESPEDFQEFLAELIEDWQPAGAMEMTLVEDLATLEMERRLVDRAQKGRLVHRLEREEALRSRNSRRLDEDATSAATRDEVVAKGLRNSPDCPAKFRQMIELIEPLVACVKLGDFSCPPDEIFTTLYGENPSWRAAQIISLYSKFVQRYSAAPHSFPAMPSPQDLAALSGNKDDGGQAVPGDGPTAPSPAGDVSADLAGEETGGFSAWEVRFAKGPRPWGERQTGAEGSRSQAESEYQTLHHLLLEEFDVMAADYQDFMQENVALSRARRDSLLAPLGSECALMIRQKNSIDRHLERKMKLLILLQTERRARELGGRSSPAPDSAEWDHWGAGPCAPTNEAKPGQPAAGPKRGVPAKGAKSSRPVFSTQGRTKSETRISQLARERASSNGPCRALQAATSRTRKNRERGTASPSRSSGPALSLSSRPGGPVAKRPYQTVRRGIRAALLCAALALVFMLGLASPRFHAAPSRGFQAAALVRSIHESPLRFQAGSVFTPSRRSTTVRRTAPRRRDSRVAASSRREFSVAAIQQRHVRDVFLQAESHQSAENIKNELSAESQKSKVRGLVVRRQWSVVSCRLELVHGTSRGKGEEYISYIPGGAKETSP